MTPNGSNFAGRATTLAAGFGGTKLALADIVCGIGYWTASRAMPRPS
jgi:hypothetical protein